MVCGSRSERGDSTLAGHGRYEGGLEGGEEKNRDDEWRMLRWGRRGGTESRRKGAHRRSSLGQSRKEGRRQEVCRGGEIGRKRPGAREAPA